MSVSTLPMNETLQLYLLSTVHESELLRRLRAETAALPQAEMQIAPEQGQLMALLARLIGARRVLEVGTFTGYSSLVVAQALPADGKLIACDVSKEWTDIARRYWHEAKLEDRIELRLGPAKETLQAMVNAGGQDSFDMAFIDADKPNYDAYYELALALVRPGGVVLVDNAFRGGEVANPQCAEEGTIAIRTLNEKIGRDPRVDFALVPIGDGLMLARKKEMSGEVGVGEDMYTLRI
jgi:predicted O-methyltransferase YrrM